MKWAKLGRVFCPDGHRTWMYSHAAVPTALRLRGGLYRIYFGTRDAENHPRIGFIEVDLDEPLRVLRVSETPALDRGPLGYFDDNGVLPGPVVEAAGKLRMYFLGRNNGTRPLYYMAIGLAESEDGGVTFSRVTHAPVMSRSEHDPWMVSTPCVLYEGGRWRMWYLSGLGWDTSGDAIHSLYHVKYAESSDGLHWLRDGRVCIPLEAGETNIANPAVVREGDVYRMWYSKVVSGKGYRIGYAESKDGYEWQRMDSEVGISASSSGWDSECMAYPCVFEHKGRKYMLYSGNGFGREGFGIAVEEA
jgi:hypothetical protein